MLTDPRPRPAGSPVPLDHSEKMRLRAAAHRARTRYPGPVGELVSRELLTWEDFGYRFGLGENALIQRLLADLLAPDAGA